MIIKKGNVRLTDVSISVERNVFKKEPEKILKYENLIIESYVYWNVHHLDI